MNYIECIVVIVSYEKAVEKLKKATYTSDLAMDASDVERVKSRQIRLDSQMLHWL
jgi:hypothetical protein